MVCVTRALFCCFQLSETPKKHLSIVVLLGKVDLLGYLYEILYCLQSSADTVQVSINHLSFFDDAPIYESDSVTKLFVEYRFLDVAPEETETPYALPKPKPNRDINFNFTKSKTCRL